jgi:hypothetical protein
VFYHIVISNINGETLHINLTKEIVLANFVCPFINREVTLYRGEIYNMVYAIGMQVFCSNQPVSIDWPMNAQEHNVELIELNDDLDLEVQESVEKLLGNPIFRDEVVEALKQNDADFTDEIYKDAILLLETSTYQNIRNRLAEGGSDLYALFIGPHGNEAVDQIYEIVIKPGLIAHQFNIERADELVCAGPVNDDVTDAIIKAKLIVADLTGERPKSYYEIGLAHALGKPVILLAQTGTTRHFELSGHQWHYWNSSADLEPKFEKILLGTLIESGYII